MFFIVRYEDVEPLRVGEREKLAIGNLFPVIRVWGHQKARCLQRLGKMAWHSFIEKDARTHG